MSQVADMGTRLRVGVRRYTSYLLKNPRWLVMFLLGRFRVVRNRVRRGGALPHDWSPDRTEGGVDGPDPRSVLAELDENGYALGLKLPDGLVGELLQLGRKYQRQENLPPGYRKVTRIDLDEFLDLAKECPAVRALQQDRYVRYIAAEYLNAEPVLLGTRLWWTTPPMPGERQPEEAGEMPFHYDVHDYASVKFSFYLVDVDPDCGPHVFVRGSHQNKRWRDQMTFMIGRQDEYIERTYGGEQITVICGPAGCGFAHDPYCYHKGLSPVSGKRLVFQLEFSRNTYQRSPYRRETQQFTGDGNSL